MLCRQNWSEECEKELNLQINREYQASYIYHAISSYFGRGNVGLDKLKDFFGKQSLEEREHADKLMNYQNMRGGKVLLNTVSPVIIDNDLNSNYVLDLFKMGLKLERDINENLLNLHKTAESESDPQFSDYLEGEFLKEQVESIYEFGKIISQLEKIGNDNGSIWLFINNYFE